MILTLAPKSPAAQAALDDRDTRDSAKVQMYKRFS